jgi:hypothetical protein
MADRAALAARFLDGAGWGGALRAPLAGDASGRRYERLSRCDGSAVLMDAPPETGEDVRPFLAVARHLAALGFSAPAILAADEAAGLLLLEDFGDDLFARLCARAPAREAPLYAAAAEFLAALHRHPAPSFAPPFDAAAMAPQIAPLFDFYLPGAGPRPADAFRADFIAALREALAYYDAPSPVLVLRDFHAENLLWLPARKGDARIGLLDFQDAKAGHPAYDLASLLADARRDVSEAAREGAIRAYLDASGADPEDFAAALALQGVQRNLRILGIFARLASVAGKPRYLDFMPRVWGHLSRDLAHPALAGLRSFAEKLPPPGAGLLERLRA